MPDEDNDRRDQRNAAESGSRRAEMGQERDKFWLRLGYDISTTSGFERLLATLALPGKLGIDVMDAADVKEKREAVAWAVRAQKRAATFGTRLLAWITGSIAILGGLAGIAKYLQDWRGH